MKFFSFFFQMKKSAYKVAKELMKGIQGVGDYYFQRNSSRIGCACKGSPALYTHTHTRRYGSFSNNLPILLCAGKILGMDFISAKAYYSDSNLFYDSTHRRIRETL